MKIRKTLKKLNPFVLFTWNPLSWQIRHGGVLYSTDEMTGVQALEHKYADKPVRPGSPALHEFEDIRHGTTSLIAFLRIADGHIHAPYPNDTRNEEDFCNAVR